jgi:hypothetical protein
MSSPIVLFCADPLDRHLLDSVYLDDVSAAEAAGLSWALVDYEALVYDSNPVRAVRRVPETDSATLGVFRGWMMTPPQYAQLYSALEARDVTLINHPAAYDFPALSDREAEHLCSGSPELIYFGTLFQMSPPARKSRSRCWASVRKHGVFTM